MNMILIRGLPGSGKTTLANALLDVYKYGVSLEADHFFENEEGEYIFNKDNLWEAHSYCQRRATEELNAGNTVIVSNTFTTIRELQPYFDIAKAVGIVPTVIVCQNDWGSVHNVPVETMIAMKRRFVHDISRMFNTTSA